MKIFENLVKLIVGGRSTRVHFYMFLICHFKEEGYRKVALFLENRLQRKYGIFVSSKAMVPKSVRLRHPTGVVVGEGVKLGERVVIFQNVTLGRARQDKDSTHDYPEIGDDTIIFAGAVIVGGVKVGKHCIVGANSVVTKDVPDYVTVVGVPARIVKTNCQVKNY